MITLAHHLPGRLRLHCPSLRRHLSGATDARAAIGAIQGVRSVEVSPLTGGIIIAYDAKVLTLAALLATLRAKGFPVSRPAPPAVPKLPAAVGEAAARMAVETLIQRSAVTLIAALV